ncbi:nitroreductase family protein [Xylanibacillus composti]|uniref:Nitroreductase n=1 Tax=Xylanibacillus composti TaxID=1572762 RepID=A0A8J4H479_9BACL|nr:nitroreductase family protein [Xylanibacillus composti]MDT9724244.1 nitroreductase family protein [Xylanibacillus composti]GIQ68238.1 nitroreductase [Xylanibacillus composti]
MSDLKQIKQMRNPDYPILPLFLERWSPRSFEIREIPEDVLYSLFEAARWAPSASNLQPWQFIIARTSEDRERFLSFILEGNTRWCKQASAFALLVSNKLKPDGGDNRNNAFDAGTCWGYLALEAANQGLAAHAMAGFNAEKARETLAIPEQYELHCVIAIGYRASADQLPDDLREREVPSGRRPLEETLHEGRFGAKPE